MREYVEKTLHTRVDCEPVDASGLPLYLRGLYSLERWTAFGVPFAVAFPVESPTVKTMAKHRDALEAALGTPVSFALEGATGYRVGRMLEAGLPFIAPDKQVYLPFLGIALSSGRSHARDRRQTDVGTFSPQAQRLALMVFYGDLDGASVTQAAGLLGAAKMTASRAFDELAAADPSIVGTEGRRRVLRPGRDKMAMWRRLEPRMSSPVAREHAWAACPMRSFPLAGSRRCASSRCCRTTPGRLSPRPKRRSALWSWRPTRATPVSTSQRIPRAWCRCCATSPCRRRDARSTRFRPSCPFPPTRGTTRASRAKSRTF